MDIFSILNDWCLHHHKFFSAPSQARADNLEKILLKERAEHQDTRVSFLAKSDHMRANKKISSFPGYILGDVFFEYP